MPLTPSGKIDRLRLPPPFAGMEAQAMEKIPPRTPLETTLVHIWEEVLGVQPVGVEDNFFDLGGHSLLAAKLFSRIQHETGYRMPLTSLFLAPTVAGLAKRIETREDYTTQILVPIQVNGSHPPFFCVHGFGGGVLGYAPLVQYLGNDFPFYGLQARGYDDEGKPLQTVEEMASAYILAIRTVQPEGPYYLGGYCFGGVVAFEMARQLDAAGEKAALVAIMEGYAPNQTFRKYGLRGVIHFARNLPFWLGDFFQLNRAEMKAMILRRMRFYGKKLARKVGMAVQPAPEDVVVEDISQVPARHRVLMEAQIAANNRYHPQAYHGRVALFRVHKLSLLRGYDPLMGWGKLSEGVDLYMISGRHHDIIANEHAQDLAEQLRSALKKA